MKNNGKTELDFMRRYAYRTVGPVMYEYVRWILKTAVEREITKLYFLARDGYLLMKIAEKICEAECLDVECKYLYCSRSALRMPTYRLIGDEMYSLLLLGGYYLTPRTVLARADITDGLAINILSEIGIHDADKPMSDKGYAVFCDKIRENERFYEAVLKKSDEVYPPTIQYLAQEGLLDGPTVAIADSGWTGSMQRSLRQLLRSAGYGGKIVGFYFGLYTDQRTEDGEYLTFYFDASSGDKRKANFNNNLFECMLSAPHPMTLRYRTCEGACEPVFAENHDPSLLPLINAQVDGALKYTDDALAEAKLQSGAEHEKSLLRCYKILRRAMVYPTRAEALMYSKFSFCDDITEGYKLPLASLRLRRALSGYMLVPRIFRKLTGRKRHAEAELLWVWGVIALMPPLLRPWYRINVKLWEWLKLKLNNRRHRRRKGNA